MVKQFDTGMEDLVWILLDLEGAAHHGQGQESTEEYAVTAAASIARSYSEAEWAVGLMALGDRPWTIPPQEGAPGLDRLLLALTEARAQGTVPIRDLLANWHAPGCFQHRNSHSGEPIRRPRLEPSAGLHDPTGSLGDGSACRPQVIWRPERPRTPAQPAQPERHAGLPAAAGRGHRSESDLSMAPDLRRVARIGDLRGATVKSFMRSL